MFTRCLCLALCLVSAPAFAANITITEDTAFRHQLDDPSLSDKTAFIDVFGDATLTLDPGDNDLLLDVRPQIRLHNSAKLVMNGGFVKNHINMLGTANEIDFAGGRFKEGFYVRGDGSGVINVGVDAWLVTSFVFTGGQQLVTAYSDGVTSNGSNINADNNPGMFVSLSLAMPFTPSNTPSCCDPFQNLDGTDWIANATKPWLEGDTNNDGSVDVADLNLVRNNFGVFNVGGDTLPFNGSVDIEDLNRIRNNFGATGTPQPTLLNPHPVPEPSSLAITAMAVLAPACIALQRRRLSRQSRMIQCL